jgi:hypothetical protein
MYDDLSMPLRAPLLLAEQLLTLALLLDAEDGDDGADDDKEEETLLDEGPALLGRGAHNKRLILCVLAAGPLDVSQQTCEEEKGVSHGQDTQTVDGENDKGNLTG